MIRTIKKDDLNQINSIGSLISENFINKNNIEERMSLDYVNIFVLEEDNIIKGFIEIEHHFEVAEIINIAVAEKYQNQGVATKLLDYIVTSIPCEKILLEVRENNAKAISFYTKNKFVEVNRRQNYYGNESAIVMERKI